jgi:hypothetical protein
MKQTIVIRTGVLVFTILIGYAVLLMPALAHENEHEESSTSSAHTEAAELKRLETLLSTLQQLVVLLTELKKIQPATTWTTPEVTVPVVTTPPVHTEAEEAHGGEHTETTTTPVVAPTVPKLLIELEEHSGKTHAHVRYVDGKPEAMFFVDPPLSDENAVVAAIAAKTGLSQEEVRGAIKYTGM